MNSDNKYMSFVIHTVFVWFYKQHNLVFLEGKLFSGGLPETKNMTNKNYRRRRIRRIRRGPRHPRHHCHCCCLK